MPQNVEGIVLYCCLASPFFFNCERVDDEFADNESPSLFSEDTSPNTGEIEDPLGSPSISETYYCDPANLGACPVEKKCAPILLNEKIDRYECVVDQPRLDPYGLCTVSAVSNDNCPIGYSCNQAGVLGDAYCQPLCGAQGDCPINHECRHHLSTEVRFCQSICDPIAQDCPTGLSCLQSELRFTCRQPTKLDSASFGQICADDHDTQCNEGLLCTPGSLLSGCISSHCCTSLCALDNTSTPCPSPYVCSSISSFKSPELSNVGACLIPAALAQIQSDRHDE